MPKCFNCSKNEAVKDDFYGWLPCLSCRGRQNKIPKARKQVEFVGEDIKSQRKAYGTDILPAHRKGVLDKGFIDRYGVKKAKEQDFSDEEIKKAKYVWEEGYYKEH